MKLREWVRKKTLDKKGIVLPSSKYVQFKIIDIPVQPTPDINQLRSTDSMEWEQLEAFFGCYIQRKPIVQMRKLGKLITRCKQLLEIDRGMITNVIFGEHPGKDNSTSIQWMLLTLVNGTQLKIFPEYPIWDKFDILHRYAVVWKGEKQFVEPTSWTLIKKWFAIYAKRMKEKVQ